MAQISPEGPVYQAGTLSGNPIAMSAGLAMLEILNNTPEIYAQIDETTQHIVDGIKENLLKLGLPYTVNHIGSMYSLFFTESVVVDFKTAKKCDTIKFGQYFHAMLQAGIYLAPSQFESLFISNAITPVEIEKTIHANLKALTVVT